MGLVGSLWGPCPLSDPSRDFGVTMGSLPPLGSHGGPCRAAARRFESLDQEMNGVMGRILDVNQVVQQLVEGGHPSAEEVCACQDHLNGRYGGGVPFGSLLGPLGSL